MKTLADIRRRMSPGTKTEIVNHVRPEASGPRIVEKNQVKQLAWRMPDGRVTWLAWPKASDVQIDGPDKVTFLVDGRPFVTIVFA